MAYEKQNWADGEAGGTPLSAARLNHIETGIEEAASAADSAPAWGEVTGKPSTFTPASHTHTIANVTGLQDELDGKQESGSYAAASHTHTVANVTGLQAALDGKQASGNYAASSHTHTMAQVTGLEAALTDITNRLDALEAAEPVE